MVVEEDYEDPMMFMVTFVNHAYYIQVVLNYIFSDIPSVIQFQIKCDNVLRILNSTICLQNVFTS